MRGPYVFRDKDPNLNYKYVVGDWVCGDDSDLWKITHQITMNGQKAYDVSKFLPHRMTELGLRNYGDSNGISETAIRPITDQPTILLCLASDIKAKQHKLLQEVQKLGDDFDALIRTRELMKS